MSDLMHYGMPRRSGRYPWGSGDEPFQHNGPSIIGRAEKYKKDHPNASQGEIAEFLGISRNDYQHLYSAYKDEEYSKQAQRAIYLSTDKNKQYSNRKIASELGISEAKVRELLKGTETKRMQELNANVEVLRQAMKQKPYIDISDGVAENLGMSPGKFEAAYKRLCVNGEASEGVVQFSQMSGNKTTMKVLAPVDADWKDVHDAAKKNEIEPPFVYAENNGRTMKGIEPPVSISSNRVKIRYAEEGGTDMDGVIQIRRGVEDLSLGKARYAQVRIAVDGTHYLKGMAVYGEKMPPGVDIVFNTNKHKGTPMCGPDGNTVLKLMKDDPENPFGATIKTGPLIKCQGKGNKINVVNEEGDWDNWSKKLAAQFISKQSPELVKKQLGYTYDMKKAEFDEIKSMTNPLVKKHLMEKFAESCDSDAVDLKAAALPRQGAKVILPLPKMNPNEVYAPGYKDGEKVVLLRYPHAGPFELPELKVNNNVPQGKKMIGQSKDAIGIHPKAAMKMSGADFDGDTVMIIPQTKNPKIRVDKSLKGLENFDPHEEFKGYKGMKIMSKENTGKQMGMITNLLTDMSVAGAPKEEYVRAVKHSMVVIDAHKHKLNYKLSEQVNGIPELKKKYQNKADGSSGATTLLSRAKGQIYVDHYLERGFDKETGEKNRYYTGARSKKRLPDGTYVDDGPKQIKSTQMYEAKDARDLLSPKPNLAERTYATYANNMKALANKARVEVGRISSPKYNPTAAKTYAKEVGELEATYNHIMKQKPLERKAVQIMNHRLAIARQNNPSLYQDKDEYKKVKRQLMEGARYQVGKGLNDKVVLTNEQWAAIQSGAIRSTKARTILMKCDGKQVRELASPKPIKGVSQVTINSIQAKLKAGWTQTDIAEALGVSVSTVRKYA